MNKVTEHRPGTGWLRLIGSLFTCVVILAATIAAVIVINRTEPVAKKNDSSRRSAALVDIVTVERGTYAPRLVVLGTVQAAQDVVLSPRVGGQVVEMSPKLVPGEMVRKGDLMVRLDPADFENAVSIRQSELAQAEASREIEQARQRLAEKELKLLEGTIDETNRALVMREPQIASIEAEVSAAKAAVERARLDLNRTRIYAPFDAQVLSRSVNIGSQVSPGDELGRLTGLKEYWIMAAVPVRSLRWIQFSDAVAPESTPDPLTAANTSPSGAAGSRVILRDPDVWGPDVERHAYVARMIGTLDSQTRLARVLIIVDDPLGYESGAPPLILDSLIETEIEGRVIEDVVRLQRDYVRDQDTAWVFRNDQLEIRPVEVVFRDARYAYIRKGLDTGDQVVTTTLATVAEGISLRLSQSASTSEDLTAEDSSGEVSPEDFSASDPPVEADDSPSAKTPNERPGAESGR